MGMSIFEKLQAKLEVFRLEKRYTRHRHRRSTFVSNAVYVDGEYVFQTPNSTGSSSNSDSSDRVNALHGEQNRSISPVIPEQEEPEVERAGTLPKSERKRLHRFSSMPGFGGDYTPKASRVVERRLSTIR